MKHFDGPSEPEIKLLIEHVSSTRVVFWNPQPFWKELLQSCSADQEILKNELGYMIEKYKEKFTQNIRQYLKYGMKMPHEQDRRKEEIYIYDVVEGWFLEEIVARWIDCQLRRHFPEVKFTVEFSGKDKGRQFVFVKERGDETSTDPDLTITLPQGRFYFELQTSRQGRRDIYDIKESKRNRLAKKEGVLLFALLPSEGTFFLIPSEHLPKLKVRVNNAWGGKLTAYVTAEQIEKYGWGYYNFSEGFPPSLVEKLRFYADPQ